MPEIIYDDEEHKKKREYMRQHRAKTKGTHDSVLYYKNKTNTTSEELKQFKSINDKLEYLKMKSFILDNNNKIENMKQWVNPQFIEKYNLPKVVKVLRVRKRSL